MSEEIPLDNTGGHSTTQVHEAVERNRVLCFPLSLFSYITAFLISVFQYKNNAWIVMTSDDETVQFQRGLGDDCLMHSDGEGTFHNISCTPWGQPNTFSAPFEKTESAPTMLKMAHWMAFIWIWVPAVLLVLTFVSCCSKHKSWKNMELVKEGRIAKMGWVVLAGKAFGAILFLLIAILVVSSRYSNPIVDPIPAGFSVALGGALKWFTVAFLVFSSAGFCLFCPEVTNFVCGPRTLIANQSS